MSRTVKGNKAAGYEYWGKRPTKGHLPLCKLSKRFTHKAERKQRLSEAQTQLDEELDGTQFTKYIDWYEGYYGT